MNRSTTCLALSALGLAFALSLTACGGGGGSDASAPAPAASSPTAGGAGSSSSGSGSTPSAPTPVAARLSGVAAYGAPLSAARLQVIDGTGALVGSTTTNSADGSFALTLQPAVAPLLLQAVGTDASGQPLVLHSALSTLASAAVIHVTPLTDAAVALALGVEPRTVFAPGAATSTRLEALANLAAASDFVKTLVKANLADAKTGDAKKLDLFSDPAFSANKTGVDLALETLAVGYGNSAKGSAQLQLGNKLGSTPIEVSVDLQTARAELAKTAGTPASAITSTVKATTSPTTVMANLGSLDELGTALNKVLAEASTSPEGGATLGLLSRTGLLARYTLHNGSTVSTQAGRLAGFAARNMQIGRLQVTGCADETITKTGCVRVAVAARVNDASGAQADSYVEVVSFDAKSSPKWAPTGNGHVADMAARSVAWQAFNADGSKAAPTADAPWLGVQISIGSSASSATVQTPGGYALPLADCARNTLCISTGAGGADSAPIRGTLADDTVFQGINAWLGTADVANAARYKASLVASDGSSSQRSAVLRGSFVDAPAADRFPVLDDVKASQSLPGTALLTPTTVAWTRWAAGQSDMRVVLLRAVYTNSSGEVLVSDRAPKSWSATSIELQPPESAADFGVVSATLWLAAVDSAGRWYYSSYSAL